ncbi:putative transcriptional regulator [Candidatus Methanoperedens nitroreducens]|uniref:Putative transcriptional regulator n=1 Tax=Candidatus Methanoperedens nitratireducens TaxID=1392998 RepID=A0A062UYW7_9EURY|nr:transcriptional regulator FilR1 domain-containing protein [Candidatus Methanoperedens nitroreducens]KCZ72126.1 putative transcriptional regulator [Candidatus Methanoperedens nitroreducens]MDJ1421897.1 DUF1724 domain-containing protein [Candidatus Methanoperedens sp.]
MNTDNKNVLNLAICSNLRKNILISLIDGKKSTGNLRDNLKTSSSTIIHALRELERNHLIFQDRFRNYMLTNTGRIITLKLIDFNNAAEALKKHEKFWLGHDLSGIPEHLMEKIGWLKDSNVVQIDPLDIIKMRDVYTGYIKTAKWIKRVSPVYSPDYTVIFKVLVENSIDTCLILNMDIFNKLKNIIGLEDIKNAISNHRLEVLITDEKLKVALTVTDTHISLGLFTTSGVYDTTYDLIGTDDMSVRWGYELFEYYRGKAKRYEI